MHTYDFLTSNPWLIILILLAVFGALVLVVILIKKYSPHFQNTDKLKSEEEIAKEEVDRLIVPMDEENKSLEEVKEERKNTIDRSIKPSEEEAASYESHRATVKADESLRKQMEEYAKAHPEEEAIAIGDLNLEESKKDK